MKTFLKALLISPILVLLAYWAYAETVSGGAGSSGGGGGGGLSVPFGGAIGANGTPVGLKDPATGFQQPFQGDTTNGLWVNIKQGPLGVAKTAIYTSQTASIIMGLINSAPPTGGTDGTLDFPSLTTARAWRNDQYSWAGTALGAPSNYGTSPGAVEVPGVNNFTTGAADIGATAASIPSSAVLDGCRGSSAEPTAVTDGQLTAFQCGLGGKQISLPYAAKELGARGTVTTTGAGAATIIAAGSGSNKTYVTGVQCWNTSVTAVTITFNDVETTGSGTTLFLPAGGGNNAKFDVPIVTAMATALTFTPSGAQTTLGCNAQGYYGL